MRFKNTLAAGVTLLALLASASVAHAAPPTPLGHWKFDEGSGDEALDASGNDNGATISGAEYVEDAAPLDDANLYSLDFDGVDDGIPTPVSLNGMDDFTLAGWINPHSANANEGWFGADDVVEFFFEDSTTMRCWTSAGAASWSFAETPGFLNSWHHVACMGTGSAVRMYVDGLLVAETEHEPTLNYGSGSSVSIGLGVQSPGGGAFDGYIDDVRVYDVALTVEQMKSLGTGGDVSFPGEGEGIEEAPYLVASCEELQAMNLDLGAYYRLANNIDCDGTSDWNMNEDEWEVVGADLVVIPDPYGEMTGTDVVVENNGHFGFDPIGNYRAPFTGVLDGDGYTVSDLWIFRKAEEGVGLFGYTLGATLFDLSVVGADVVGGNSTGALVGRAESTDIDDVTLQDNVVRAYLAWYGGGLVGRLDGEGSLISDIQNIGGSVHGSGMVIGGLIGRLEEGELRDSLSSADVDGGYSVGGAVGEAERGATLLNVHATGDVFSDHSEVTLAKTGYYAGGLVGYLSGESLIVGSSASGLVTTEGKYAGGLVGYVSDSQIQTSSSTGSVIANEVEVLESLYEINAVGGFIGGTYGGSVIGSWSSGSVISDADEVGGFVGLVQCEASFEESFATGNVTGKNYVGGFVGNEDCEMVVSNFRENFATGNVTGEESVGGFAGNLYASAIVDAYSQGSVSGDAAVGGFAGSVFSPSIENAYSSGEVSGSTAPYVNGFIGQATGDYSVSGSFWDGDVAFAVEVSCGADAGDCYPVARLSTEQMKEATAFQEAGWDFEEVWGSDGIVNRGYPYFVYQTTYSDETSYPITLVEVTPIAAETTAEDAVFYFSVDNPEERFGEFVFEELETEDESAEVRVDVDGGFVHFSGLDVGQTYETSFRIEGEGGALSNWLTIGPFTVIESEEEEQPARRRSSRRRGGARDNFGAAANVASAAPSAPSAPVAAPAGLAVRDLEQGLSGDDVRALQALLIGLGYEIPAGATGYFGQQTRAALAAYQAQNGIAPAAGYFGPRTRAQMTSAGHAGLWW